MNNITNYTTNYTVNNNSEDLTNNNSDNNYELEDSTEKEIEEIILVIKSCVQDISEIIRFNNNNEFNTEFDKIVNSSGDNVKLLDISSNNIMRKKLSSVKTIKFMISEENKDVMFVNNENGKYIVCFDPLDGSSNIDVNITVGTIFGIYKVNNNAPLFGNGKNLIASGYSLYGSSTDFIYTTENMMGIQMETLNRHNKWIIYKQKYKMPLEGKIYAINESNKYKWTDKTWNKLINKFIEKKYTTRWVGSMVADVHRTLLKGGLFAYPENTTNKEGRLRLLYEVLPMSYLVYKAGGYSFNKDNLESILNMNFSYYNQFIHIKKPIILCSEVEYKMFTDIVNTKLIDTVKNKFESLSKNIYNKFESIKDINLFK